MALTINNAVTERLVRQLAKQTGESITDAVRRAVKERLERLRKPRRDSLMLEELHDILRRVDALPKLDNRPDDEILGYDRDGIPD